MMWKPIIGLVLSSTLIMPRLRKSNQPAVSTPTPPGVLTRTPTSLPQEDSRALTTSSTTIAPSVASPFYGVRDVSSDGDVVQGGDTSWKTVYSAARMTVEIAKESSDMFLPLKAVMGAVSVLIKNYDVSVPCQ